MELRTVKQFQYDEAKYSIVERWHHTLSKWNSFPFWKLCASFSLLSMQYNPMIGAYYNSGTQIHKCQPIKPSHAFAILDCRNAVTFTSNKNNNEMKMKNRRKKKKKIASIQICDVETQNTMCISLHRVYKWMTCVHVCVCCLVYSFDKKRIASDLRANRFQYTFMWSFLYYE